MYYQQYLDSQSRVEELVTPLGEDVLNVVTRACPQWRVRDVLAHLAGAAASFGTESFAGVGSPNGAAFFNAVAAKKVIK